MRTHLSLFSGIGGLDLAAEWAGFTSVGQCEFADYPTKVLEKHWPDVPRWRDIRTLTGEDFRARTGLGTVDIISGGFPCQPFSVAGKQKGREDDRYLWPEMLRVIRELRPRWVVGENVPGILRIAAADVVQDLEREGFECVLFDFEAAAVGAYQRRERIAFVAHAYSRELRHDGNDRRQAAGKEHEATNAGDVGGKEKVVAGAQSSELQREWRTARGRWAEPGRSMRWPAEPDVGRVAHGVPNRVDRLKCLGNAVVPQQFYPIFDAIRQVMEGEHDDP